MDAIYNEPNENDSSLERQTTPEECRKNKRQVLVKNRYHRLIAQSEDERSSYWKLWIVAQDRETDFMHRKIKDP